MEGSDHIAIFVWLTALFQVTAAYWLLRIAIATRPALKARGGWSRALTTVFYVTAVAAICTALMNVTQTKGVFIPVTVMMAGFVLIFRWTEWFHVTVLKVARQAGAPARKAGAKG